MSTTTTVTSIFSAYHNDLRGLVESAATALGGQDRQESLLRKLCIETSRLVAYQRAYLLPALASVPDDGRELARLEDERLSGLLAAAEGVAATPWGDEAIEPLGRLGRAADELARHQRERTFPRLEQALPAEQLEAIGDEVTPTEQPGTTHSHPVALKRFDGPGWPQPGFAQTAYEAFVDETRSRRQAGG